MPCRPTGSGPTWGAQGDRNKAVGLYTLNAVLSECLHLPLHMLEVTLRNRVHIVMSKVHGDSWFDMPKHQLNPTQSDMLAKARQDLANQGKDGTPGRTVAAVTFGFWTAILGKEYENLWQKTLKSIARREDGKGLTRKDFTRPLGAIRMLRNRLAHHETVLHWDLPKHHASILQLTAWLSPVAAEWSKDHCRFEKVYPDSGIDLTGEAANDPEVAGPAV